jgi:hypothetical protein
MDLDLDLSFGLDEAQRMADSVRTSGGYRKVNFLRIKDGESIILRFLEDNWPSVLQHSFVPTKPPYPGAPDRVKENWPERSGAVCRKTPKFERHFPQGCVICDMTGNSDSWNGRYNPSSRLWVRAVERKEVLVETPEEAREYGEEIGTFLGYTDVEDEVDETDAEGKPTGQKVMRKRIIVINQGPKNFFSTLQGYKSVYKTITDRDYFVTRHGEKTKTDYDIIALDPVRDEAGKVWKMTDPEIINGEKTGRTLADAYLEFAPELKDLIASQLDDDHYAKFFDPSMTFVPPQRDDDKPAAKTTGKPVRNVQRVQRPPSTGTSSTTAAPADPPPAERPATASRLAEIREGLKQKVKNQNPGTTPEQQSSEDGSGSAEPVSVGAAGAQETSD